MMGKIAFKACRHCRYLADTKADACPNCGSNDFTRLWRGHMIIVDPGRSKVAEKIDAKIPGNYAIKVSR